ncbi:hypothetical protein P154DRAFT_527242 [Amniculicola lignicola CBS 123094]|uniref:Uncharacterized protein n=1 Tax=Amniculicola lignicola CBS 123094 TaxID=1392246 RepID=A0A6A5VXM2_9PLEO|nr:hypothetical protein P154DRAFT_527242 [Amniculicola lignicola CBS 123094]
MGGNVFQSNLFTPPAGGNMFRAQNTPATPAGGNMFKFQSTRATPAGGNMFGAQNALDHFNHPPNPPALQQMPPSFGGGQASTAPVGNFGTPFSGAPDPFSGLSAPAQTPLQIASAPSWNFNAQNTSTPAPGSDGSLFTFGGNSGNSGNTSGNTLLAAPPGGARRILKPKGRMGRGR